MKRFKKLDFHNFLNALQEKSSVIYELLVSEFRARPAVQSLYKTILSRFFTASLIPILFIEFLLILAMVWLINMQTSAHKQSTMKISDETFIEISKNTAHTIKQQFNKATDELLQLRRLAFDMFNFPQRYMDSSLKLRFDQGFWRDGEAGALSSIYTTNIKKMTPKHEKNMQILSLLAIDAKQVVVANKDLIQSAWVNIGKYYSLFHPMIDVPNELSSDLDVTQQRFYYLADETHNPSKDVVYIDLYNEEWATQFGQMGAYLAPIYKKEKFIGVIGVNVTVEKSAKTLQSLKLPFNAYAMLVDSHNRLLISSDENRSFEDLNVRSFYYEYLRALRGDDHNALQTIDMDSFEHSEKVIHSQPIEGTSLRVMFCTNEADIYRHLDAISANGRRFGIMILVVIAFFYGIYFVFLFKSVRNLAHKISIPVRRIVEFSSNLGKDAPLNLEKSSIDELEILNGNLESTHHELIQLVNYDPTTKLINHRKLREDIGSHTINALFLFHVKSYAQYTNLFGPKVGNAVLMHVISLIQKCKEAGDLYQENKDTIALVLRHDMSADDIKGQMQQMLDTISNEKFTFEGLDINLTVVGAASMGNCDDGLNILSQAHIALSKASEQVTGKCVIYDDVSEITKQYEENILWGQRVKDALLEGNFEAFFQPMMNYKDGSIEKCEALVRMRLDGEIISPFKFLYAAQNIGKLHEITLVMVDQVFEVAKSYPNLEFSINTSFDDFEEGKLVDYVKEKLKQSKIDPSKIIFEILETQTFNDQNLAIGMISELKALGFKIAIDDFGTGHSNFAHVTLMDVDYIKIDGMFIKDLDTNALSQTMVTTLVYFTKQIGAKTIAEFVHNDKVFEKAKGFEVDFAQGYFISEPLSAEELKRFLASS